MTSLHDLHRRPPFRRFVGGATALLLTALPALAQTQVWIDQFGWEKKDEARVGAPDGAGGAYLAGYGTWPSPGTTQSDVVLARYDDSGRRLWLHRFGTGMSEEVYGAAPDGSGGVFLVGTSKGGYGGAVAPWNSWVGRYDASGTELWVRPILVDLVVTRGASDGAGGVLVCGYTSTFQGAEFGAARLDPNGDVVWSRRFADLQDHVSKTNLVGPDGAGGAYVAGGVGQDQAPDEAWLARLDATGQTQWSVRISFGSGWDEVRALLPDGTGGVFVGGFTTDSNWGTSNSNSWIRRFDADGDILWTYESDLPGADGLWTLASDGAGGLLATVHQNAKSRLQRFDRFGDLLYSHPITDTNFVNLWFSFEDGKSGIYVGGSTDKPVTGPVVGSFDLWLARYDGSCNYGTIYCTASTTSLPGCKASISGSGSPTLSDPGAYTISSGAVPGGNIGLLLFGSSGKDSTPYGTLGGVLCVAAPTFRTAPTSSGGDPGQCNGIYSFTLQDLVDAGPLVESGAVLDAQVWARDPASADGFLLSDGIEFTVCP